MKLETYERIKERLSERHAENLLRPEIVSVKGFIGNENCWATVELAPESTLKFRDKQLWKITEVGYHETKGYCYVTIKPMEVENE